MQRFNGPPELIVDVAHNPQASAVLAEWLAAHPPAGRNIAVFGALADKDITGIVAPLREVIHAWHLAGLDTESLRGLDAATLAERLANSRLPDTDARHPTVADALSETLERAGPGDRIVAFGSFFVASAALRVAASRGMIASRQTPSDNIPRLGQV